MLRERALLTGAGRTDGGIATRFTLHQRRTRAHRRKPRFTWHDLQLQRVEELYGDSQES